MDRAELPANPRVTPAEAIDLGLSVIPCGPNKRPVIKAWKPFQSKRATKEELEAWHRLRPALWAIITGAISRRVVLDFDGEAGVRTMSGLGIKPHRSTPSGGFHADFHHPGWRVPTLNSRTKRELGARWPGLDIRADGGYAIFDGRTARGEYRWLRDPAPYPLDLLPAELRQFLGLAHPPKSPASINGTERSTASAGGRVDAERLMRMAIERAGVEGRNNSGLWLACQLRDNGYAKSEALAVMRSYRACAPGTNTKGAREAYTEQEVFATVKEAYSRPAREAWARKPAAPAKETPAGRPRANRAELLSQPFSDYGNAQRVIACYGADLRYCYEFRKWLVWDVQRWAVDEGERARKLSQATILEFARQATAANNREALKFAASCLNSQRISNALREAQPHLTIAPVDLDTHPDLLNFANCTLDLKTGYAHPQRPEDFITKLVHHDYVSQAECPLFLTFLKRITANHPGLISYLQRAFGYSLTGHTKEKAVFLLHGRGDNGKSTLLTLFLKLLEEYAGLLQIDTLMVRQESNNTQADLADLRGARFVMTSETEEGQRLAEGKLKRITQGMGRIKATRKYENPIEFPESHKLWIDANHLPIVRGTDNAIWNRLHPVPFDITIPKAGQDRDLPAKLAAESEGILAWAVAGAARWYKDGLGRPGDVDQASQSWRAASDQIGRFIEEACMTAERVQAKAHPLYLAYKSWAIEGGEQAETERVFGERMAERYTRKKEAGGNVYLGIGLLEGR